MHQIHNVGFTTAVMRSGKSYIMKQEMDRHRYVYDEEVVCLVFHPVVYSSEPIFIKDDIYSQPVNSIREIISFITTTKTIPNNVKLIISIDEIQFFFYAEMLDELRELAHLSQVVYVNLYGLIMTFVGDPFGFALDLLYIVGNFKVLNKKCDICKKKLASRNMRAAKTLNLNVIEKKYYKSVCYQCWTKYKGGDARIFNSIPLTTLYYIKQCICFVTKNTIGKVIKRCL